MSVVLGVDRLWLMRDSGHSTLLGANTAKAWDEVHSKRKKLAGGQGKRKRA
jgi:ATP-dependent RNA helicase DDX24/MAK5